MRNNIDLYRRNRSTLDLFQELDDFFERTFRNPTERSSANQAYVMNPEMDVRETDQAFFVSLDVPGIKKENVKIGLQGRTLTVSGERRSEEKGENDKSYSRSFGQFSRSFTLPDIVNVEKIEADMADGVLTISLPKAPASQPRQIEIGASKQQTIETQKH